ncbi:GAP family protein [Streptomyces sp. NPDC093225]|uniref:GAP family protein n=1 Tax=Streptomyces sp. NPDC093225 TaxID=3366034 RepID=UPI00380003E7
MTAEVVLLSLVIALSPFTLIPALFMQFAPRARQVGSAFMAGWLVGVAIPASLTVALAELLHKGTTSPSWTAWVRVGLGVLLIGLGIEHWLDRHGKGPPRWMRLLADATPAKAVRLGLVLSLANPKIFLVSAAAGVAIAAGDPTAAGAVLGVVLFTACAASTVILPVLLRFALGDRVVGPLGRTRTALEGNAAAVMAVAIIAIGILVLVEGLTSI